MRTVLILSASILLSCGGPAIRHPALQRVAPLPTPSLDLPPGTSLDRARSRLEQLGATNVAAAKGVEGTHTLEALTADGLTEVLLFRDGRLDQTMPIGCDRGSNVRSHLHLARSEGRTAVIVLSASLRRRGIPSVFVLLDRQPVRRYVIAYDHFPEWFKGVADPRIVGTDLAGSGVTLVARGDDGLPWDNAVIFRCDGTQVEVTPVSMVRAASCDCIFDWYTGAR